MTIATKLRLPADLAPGDYELALWLPDAAESLRERPEYAVRFANDGVFSETRGHNVLATVTIDPEAPGESDPNATELAELP